MFIKQTTTDHDMTKKHEKTMEDDQTPSRNAPIDLTRLSTGIPARVVEIQGGHQMAGRLEAMGIIPGTVIVKKFSAISRGPIVLEKDATQLAIGYGMAQGILVEPLGH